MPLPMVPRPRKEIVLIMKSYSLPYSPGVDQSVLRAELASQMLSLASRPESMIWGHTPATGHASDLLLTPMDRSPLPLSGGIPVKVRFFVFLCSATDASILVPVWNSNCRRDPSTTW